MVVCIIRFRITPLFCFLTAIFMVGTTYTSYSSDLKCSLSISSLIQQWQEQLPTKKELRQQQKQTESQYKEQLTLTLRSGQDAQPTKKELRQQNRLERKQAKQQLPLTLRSGQEDTVKTKKQLRIERKQVRQEKKEQTLFKADSIKILAMLALRNTHEANPRRYGRDRQVDSLKKVMKNSKQLAKEAILKSEEVKGIKKELDPYLTHYKQYKSKLVLLDSGNLLKEGKSLGLQELNKNEQYQELTKDLHPYTSKLKNSNPLDSTNRQALLNDAKQLGLQELSKKEEFKGIKKELSPYLDSPYIKGIKLQDLDSMSLDSLKALSVSTFEKLEKRLEQELLKTKELSQFSKDMGEFEALKGLPESYRKQFEKYKNGEGLQKEAMAEAAKKAQALLSKHSKEIQSAQTQLAKLKKKYSSVQSSNDLSTATKRNSLQGKPLKKRIVLGINFQIVSLDPVVVDFNPRVGYKFTKKFYVAVGGSYRARFTESRANNNIRIGQDELTYGYRAFTEYNVWKMLSIHAEFERISKEFEIGKTDTFERKWVEGALAGISSSYTVKGKVKGNFSVLYNFLHNDSERVYQSPWVFRFGVSL